MASEVISADVIGPVLADAGDLIRVLEGVTVDGTGAAGIEQRTPTDNNVRIVVAGTVIGEYFGVSLDGYVETTPGEREGGNSLRITETGVINGLAAISTGYGRGDRIVNDGLIDTTFGLIGEGDETRIVNRGTMDTSQLGMSQQGKGTSIRNEGLIHDGGFYLAFGGGMRLANTGTIDTFGGSIVWDSANDFALRNDGLMRDRNVGGFCSFVIEIYSSERFKVANAGAIEGYKGIEVYNSHGVIRNSGTIEASSTAMFLDAGFGEAIRIVNSGTISGSESIVSMFAGRIDIANTGLISGDILFGDGADSYCARHAGAVAGRVLGGGGSDKLTGAGATDIFDGGDGADLLDGGRSGDMLLGQAGDDTLLGGWGRDFLDGGADADVLDGQQGDDRLTGGAGADIFVFGGGAGQDRVSDFEAGSDLLRLTGHAGGFATLAIADRNVHLEIVHDGGVIVLQGQAGLVLTAADFEFV